MTRFRCPRYALLGFLVVGALVPSCLGGSGGPSTAGGSPDVANNGHVSIDKTKLTGVLDGSSIKLSVPIQAVDPSGASGTLQVRLLDATDTMQATATQVSYSLGAGGSAMLAAELPAPAQFSGQADLSEWNVRLDDGKANSLLLTRSLLMVVPPVEVRLEGPSSVTQGKATSFRVSAQDGVTKAPIAGAKVSLAISAKDGSGVQSFDGQTRATGDALFATTLDQIGDFQVSAGTTQNGISPSVQDSVTIAAPGGKILLTSDKPIYQPGQTMSLRSLALTSPDNKPLTAASVIFEIDDGKGNKVFKKSVDTDSYGIAATTFTLGSLVNTGTFTLHATSGATTTQKTVSVSTYALPKFDLVVQTDKPWYRAGDKVVGTVDARYFFGKVVAGGSVVVQASTLDVGQTLFQQVMGTLDSSGHLQFSVTIPSTLAGTQIAQGNASVDLHVTASDTAGQTVSKDDTIVVSPTGINVALVPEATQLAAGLDNELDLFVTDPLGAPIAGAAAVITTPDGKSAPVTTDAFGQATLTWEAPPDMTAPPAPANGGGGGGVAGGPAVPNGGAAVPAGGPVGAAGGLTFTVLVTPSAGAAAVTKSFDFAHQTGAAHLIVRTDASLYGVGDTVNADIVTSDPSSRVYVDWINTGQAVNMRTLTASGGHALFSTAIDASLVGSNRIEAYVVDTSGNIVRAGRTIFVRQDNSLNVAMTQDKPTYAPGGQANLTFSVTDAQGNPAVAALGIEIVDQSVFSLVDAHPGLLRSFFELESIYSTPSYQIAAPPVDYTQLLFSDDTQPAAAQAHQTLTKASFAALGDTSVTGISHGSWTDVVAGEKKALAPAYAVATSGLSALLHVLGKEVVGELEREGCSSSQFYCSAQNDSFSDLLDKRLTAVFVAYDFWGNRYAIYPQGTTQQITTRGPDEVAGTTDDTVLSVDLSDLLPLNASAGFGGAGGAAGPEAPGVANGAAGGGSSGGTGSSSGGLVVGGSSNGGGSSSSSGSTMPRVRQDFPETLYVNPSIITGPDGVASVNVPLADSITQWRVSTMANSAAGKLGGSESGFTVFQDFFVDVNFPATLTRGDQVSFPIAVYNYRSDVQTVQLSLAAGDWYTPTGATTTSVTLQPGQVSGVSFPVRVDKVGLHSLTVTALGTSASDAVARSVQVLPDGKLVSDTSSGVLADGSTASHTFAFPAGAVAGSQQMYVEVYPAFLAHVVNGMESLLRQPTGCFEQTTSTTWPNVLVLAYLTQTNQLTPDLQLKADSLISTGYQRLLTFEHPGGGFSWFGTQDPAPYLSVTAFGLMEFADMMKVATVDEAMFARTRSWLLSQQQADGSWIGDRTEFFSFNTSTVRNTAFVLWALGSAGYTGPEVTKGLAYVRAHVSDSGNDAYTLALLANALEISAPGDPANDAVFTQLDALKQVSGDQVHWDTGGTQTNFYQAGTDSSVAATALVVNALLLDGDVSAVDGAIKYLTAQKDANGNFGSTQATIWTLRALLLAASKTTDAAVGTLTIQVDGTTAQTLALTPDQSDVVTTVDLSGQATAGNHDLSVSFAGTGKVSFNAVGKYNLPWSAVQAPPPGPLSIGVSYDKTNLYVNDTVRETVTVQNNTTSTQNMVMVTLGIPPGFSVSTSDLDALVQAHTISKYEITGKQVLLYVSQIAASATVRMQYGLTATMPVLASDGAAEAYLYYQPTVRTQSAAQTLQVLAN